MKTAKQEEYLIKFKKPYSFDGKEYAEVDLSGLENLSTKDLVAADKTFIASGQSAVVAELSVGYSCIIASKVTGKPIEFFEDLPGNEGIKVKNTVARFFYE